MDPTDTAALRAQLQELMGAELEIEEELGRGGMAVVFAARDPSLERRVAVKMLLPRFAFEADVAHRFLREGRTMASLEHPHVVSVYGVRGNEGTSAILMQYVDGRTLEEALARKRQLPLDLGLRVLAQVASALQHAHERGVVHRDVKPANVLIDRRVNAFVSDFGIARRADGTATTMTGLVLGTSQFMSPEQRAGERVTAAADQYALGVMAYELLTGRPPFTGALDEMIRGHMLHAPAPLRSVRPEIPEAVDGLVLRMLAKAPEERWPSLDYATQLCGALAPGVDAALRLTPSMPVTPVASMVPVSPEAVRRSGEPVSAPAPDRPRPDRRHRWRGALVTVLVLGGVLVLAWLATGWGS